jgi:hypothetical protein
MTTIPLAVPRHPGLRQARMRVLVLLADSAAITEPAIRNEIAALEAGHDIRVMTRRDAASGRDSASEFGRVLDAVSAFAPDVLHAHGFTQLGFVGRLAEAAGVPFTLRAHASDTATLRPAGMRARMAGWLRHTPRPERTPDFKAGLRAMANDLCLGVFILPFTRPWLVRAGVNEGKLVDCIPAMPFAAFHDRSPNGDAVMNIGADAGSRAASDILRLANKVPGREFNIYAPDDATAEGLKARSAQLQAGVNVVAPVDARAMPGEYKRHRWLVLTADHKTAKSALPDWPLAIAEAQAAGVGVCMPNLRPDLARYVGEGAGILYDSIDELPAIVSGPLPDEMRERGFAQARKSDVMQHLHLLTDLWGDAGCGRGPDHTAIPQTGVDADTAAMTAALAHATACAPAPAPAPAPASPA